MTSTNNALRIEHEKNSPNNADITGTVRSGDNTASGGISPIEIDRYTVRVELPVEDYSVLAKRAAQEGVSAEVLAAQAVGKLLQ